MEKSKRKVVSDANNENEKQVPKAKHDSKSHRGRSEFMADAQKNENERGEGLSKSNEKSKRHGNQERLPSRNESKGSAELRNENAQKSGKRRGETCKGRKGRFEVHVKSNNEG